jgi:hypothetical protein
MWVAGDSVGWVTRAERPFQRKNGVQVRDLNPKGAQPWNRLIAKLLLGRTRGKDGWNRKIGKNGGIAAIALNWER